MNVFQLEKQMVSTEEWASISHNYPLRLQDEMKSLEQPIGFGWDEEVGWFSLGSGQGPFLIWAEKVQ